MRAVTDPSVRDVYLNLGVLTCVARYPRMTRSKLHAAQRKVPATAADLRDAVGWLAGD